MVGFLPEAEYWLVLHGEAHLGQADALLLVHLHEEVIDYDINSTLMREQIIFLFWIISPSEAAQCPHS